MQTITSLKPNEVFVFGSNLAGIHGAGAAKQAREQFGAKLGVGEGITGHCYAIPTKDENIQTRSLEDIEKSINRFLITARLTVNQGYIFLVTPIGCGLAGYTPAQIAPMFKNSTTNVVLPPEFKPYLQ